MSIGDDSTSIHDALYQRLDDLRRERDAMRVEAERLSAELAYERQLHRDANAEVVRMWSILREVAGSGVGLPAEPPGLTYATVQIDGELWESLRKEFGQ